VTTVGGETAIGESTGFSREPASDRLSSGFPVVLSTVAVESWPYRQCCDSDIRRWPGLRGCLSRPGHCRVCERVVCHRDWGSSYPSVSLACVSSSTDGQIESITHVNAE